MIGGQLIAWDEYFFVQQENKKEQTDHVCRKQGATRIKSSRPPWWNLNPLWKGKKKKNKILHNMWKTTALPRNAHSYHVNIMKSNIFYLQALMNVIYVVTCIKTQFDSSRFVDVSCFTFVFATQFYGKVDYNDMT